MEQFDTNKIIVEFRKVILERERLDQISNYDNDDEIEKCWEKEVEILKEDISTTIKFLENECTSMEYVWISEIIDDLVEETCSQELLNSYKALANKYPEEYKEYNIYISEREAQLKVHGKLSEDNPYVERLYYLVALLGNEVGLSKNNQILIVMRLNTEEKIKDFFNWIQTKIVDEKVQASEIEIMNQIPVIERKYL